MRPPYEPLLPAHSARPRRPWLAWLQVLLSASRLSRTAAVVVFFVCVSALLLASDAVSHFSSPGGGVYFTNPLSWTSKRPGDALGAPDVSSHTGLTMDPTVTETIELSKLGHANSGASSSTRPVVSDKLITGDDLQELHDMVAQTKGYYARDFSLGLGFNNVRYIIEAALAQARILNRTAILPSFVYARSCEYHITVCADYAEMLNRGDAVGWDEWRELPFEEQMGWRVPMTVMLNITHMRRYQPVLLVSEYLRLHDLPTDLERDNGAWDSYAYHTNAEIFDPQNRIPDLHEIENQWFDPQNVTRVDMMPQDMKTRGGWDPEYEDASIGQRGMWTNVELSQEYLQLEAALPEDRRYLNWDEARDALHEKLKILENSDSDQALENLVKASGWEVLYTFDGALGMDYSKTVIKPIRHVVQRESLRSFLDDFGDIDANVVHLAGEIHLGRKPGGLRFTTTAGRDEFARLPLYAVRAPDALLQLAGRLDERMMAKNDGRMWMGAHMRRGDFSKVGWAMEKSIVDHLARIKRRLDGGRAILGLISDLDIHPYAIPEGHVDYSILNMKPPRDGDQFYLATDERDPDNLLYLSQNGAVLIQDILTIEDRREFGWPLMLTDVLALVEQAVLVRGHYFYGHAMSSVAGGVSNMRAANGRDPRTELID